MRISTSAGPARAELDAAEDPPFLLVLTHGAGGGVRLVVLPGAAHALAGQGGAIRRVVGAWLAELRAGAPA